MKLLRLKRQVRRSGGSNRESRELTALAGRLYKADVPGLDNDTKAKIAADIGFGYYAYRQTVMRITEGAFAALVVGVLIFAQSSRPGTTLYSVKQGTDKVQNFIVDKVPFVDQKKNDALPKSGNNQRGKNSPSVDDKSGHGVESATGSQLDTSDDKPSSISGTTTSGDSSGSGSGRDGGSGSIITDINSGKGKHGGD